VPMKGFTNWVKGTSAAPAIELKLSSTSAETASKASLGFIYGFSVLRDGFGLASPPVCVDGLEVGNWAKEGGRGLCSAGLRRGRAFATPTPWTNVPPTPNLPGTNWCGSTNRSCRWRRERFHEATTKKRVRRERFEVKSERVQSGAHDHQALRHG